MASTSQTLLFRNTDRVGAQSKVGNNLLALLSLGSIAVGGADTQTGEAKLLVTSGAGESNASQAVLRVANGASTIFEALHGGDINLGLVTKTVTVGGDLGVAENLSVTGTGSFTDELTADGGLSVDGNTHITGTLRLSENADPSTTADTGVVYVKDVSGSSDLFYRNAAGSVVQITSGSSLAASTDLQGAYDVSGSPAQIILASGKGVSVKLHNSVGGDFSIIDSASNVLFKVAENGAVMTIGHVNAVPTFAQTPVPATTATQSLGTSSRTFLGAYVRTIYSDASQDLTLDPGQDVIFNLTPSRSTAADFKNGGTSYLKINTTSGKTSVGQPMEFDSVANITFGAGTTTFNGIQVQNLKAGIVELTSGGVTAGKAIYFDGADSKVKHAAAGTALHTDNYIGIALSTVADGSAVRVLTASGAMMTDLSGLTPGATYYVSGTAGNLVSTAPSTSGDTVFRVGVAITASTLLHMPMSMGVV